MPKSDLPFGSEFSPNQIELPNLLDLINQCKGNKELFEKVLKDTFFPGIAHPSAINRNSQ